MNIFNKIILAVLRRLFWLYVGAVIGAVTFVADDDNYHGMKILLGKLRYELQEAPKEIHGKEKDGTENRIGF